MLILENQYIKASIHSRGAELHSLFNKETGLEHIWNGEESIWPRHSPVLFPIVGGLIDDTYIYKEKKYQLAKHGFARDMDFEIEHSSAEKASFILRETEETLKSYPFSFLLRITYLLINKQIHVSYQVENPADEPMYFSIGTHPAFNIPLVDNTAYEDYYLEFSETENSKRHTLDGNILDSSISYFKDQSQLALRNDLFYEDAVIFKDLKSDSISIKSNKTSHGIRFTFQGFPYMGIWAAKDAPFVCIEPWCGVPDSTSHNQNIEEKEGIISLYGKARWERSWSLECF